MSRRSPCTAIVWILICFALISGALICRPAFCDLTYTMSVVVNSTGSGSSPTRTKTTVYLTKLRKRVEITTVGGSYTQSVVMITCPDLGEVITVDPALKIYKVEPIHTVLQMLAFPEFPILIRSADVDHWSNITGISGQEHGAQMINGVMASDLVLTVHNADETTSSAPSDVSLNYWVTELNTGYSINISGVITRPDGSTISYSINGDKQLIARLTQKMPVRIVVHSTGKPDTQMDLISYSLSPIPASNFDTPAGCQLVTPEQYSSMQLKSIAPPPLSLVPAQPSST